MQFRRWHGNKKRKKSVQKLWIVPVQIAPIGSLWYQSLSNMKILISTSYCRYLRQFGPLSWFCSAFRFHNCCAIELWFHRSSFLQFALDSFWNTFGLWFFEHPFVLFKGMLAFENSEYCYQKLVFLELLWSCILFQYCF